MNEPDDDAPVNRDNLLGDYAMAHIAHIIRTYYLALTAEGFTITEAIALAAAYQGSLIATAASMPTQAPG